MAELGGQICHSINMIFPYFLVFFWELPNFSALSMFLSCFLSPASHKYPRLSSEYPPRYFIRFWWQRQMTSDWEVSVTRRPAWEPFDKHITCSWSFKKKLIEFLKSDEIWMDGNRVTISSLSQSASLAQSSLLLISTQPPSPPPPLPPSHLEYIKVEPKCELGLDSWKIDRTKTIPDHQHKLDPKVSISV